MAKANRFEDLEVWQKAMKIAEDIYLLTREEKFAREYSIKDQIIRAAISISNNISEGFEYDNHKDLIKFLRYSKGSTGEVRNMIIFLKRIGLVNEEFYLKTTNELVVLSKQLYAFINYLKKNPPEK
ncbi:MAG: four helix bundle protein [Ignavibacteria bacterium]|nr:four helix bundle protein [Ignavibacteria bacterium]MCC7159676.1 four helix bundle protein [Ignavibacteria bacterium]